MSDDNKKSSHPRKGLELEPSRAKPTENENEKLSFPSRSREPRTSKSTRNQEAFKSKESAVLKKIFVIILIGCAVVYYFKSKSGH